MKTNIRVINGIYTFKGVDKSGKNVYIETDTKESLISQVNNIRPDLNRLVILALSNK